MESFNPTGSVKDRVARSLIEDAEEKGLIRPGQTILEPTSGNTGISLAMICSRKGYRLKVVMPDNVTPERTQLLKMYGAEIVYSPGNQGSNGAVELALQMAEADASYYMPYQYGNQANPNAHYHGTAPEILQELDEVAAFVAGLGTGGTLMGVGRRFREELGDSVKIVAAEPMQGEPLQGLRSLDDGFIPPIIDLSLLDRKIFVTNRDAVVWTKKLLDEEGIFAASAAARSRASRSGSRTSSTRATSSSSSATTAGSTSRPACTRRRSTSSRTWTRPSGGRQPALPLASGEFAVAVTIASRMVTTRRALLGAGALLAAGCGPPDEPVASRQDVLDEQLRVTNLSVAAGAPRARARAEKLEAAGAKAPAGTGPSGPKHAYHAEAVALASYVQAGGAARPDPGALRQPVAHPPLSQSAPPREPQPD